MPLLLELHHHDPTSVAALPMRVRWQLLYGLHITLLDDTSASFSPLELQSQLVEAVAIAEFALDQIAWAEELDVELTEQELAACDQALVAAEAKDLLDQVIKCGLRFLDGCDLSEDRSRTINENHIEGTMQPRAIRTDSLHP